MNSELCVHVPKKKIPQLCFTKYKESPKFTTAQIILEDCPTITFFMDSLADIVAFKNSFLWAFEEYIKKQTQ